MVQKIMRLISVFVVFYLVILSVAHSSECHKFFESSKDITKKNFTMDDLIHRNASQPASERLVELLNMFEASNIKIKKAIDLGAGSGRDTLELLKIGAEVQSVDINHVAINYLNAIKADYSSRLKVFESSIERAPLIKSDLINAQNIFAFLTPEQFQQAWTHINNSLLIGGWFVGTFFDKTWSTSKTNATFTKEQVANLFINFDIISIKKEEMQGVSHSGEPIFWQVYFVTARKKFR